MASATFVLVLMLLLAVEAAPRYAIQPLPSGAIWEDFSIGTPIHNDTGMLAVPPTTLDVAFSPTVIVTVPPTTVALAVSPTSGYTITPVIPEAEHPTEAPSCAANPSKTCISIWVAALTVHAYTNWRVWHKDYYA